MPQHTIPGSLTEPIDEQLHVFDADGQDAGFTVYSCPKLLLNIGNKAIPHHQSKSISFSGAGHGMTLFMYIPNYYSIPGF